MPDFSRVDVTDLDQFVGRFSDGTAQQMDDKQGRLVE
jgi:hypothetical protein